MSSWKCPHSAQRSPSRPVEQDSRQTALLFAWICAPGECPQMFIVLDAIGTLLVSNHVVSVDVCIVRQQRRMN